MPRGSSQSFHAVLSIAYSIENNLEYYFDDDHELHRTKKIICPLDERAIASGRHLVYVSYLPNMLDKHNAQRAFVRLRNPRKQFLSYVNYLSIYHSSTLASADRAITYLRNFASDLEKCTVETKIVPVENYFLNQKAQVREFFDYFEVKVSDRSISKAIEEYTVVEGKREVLPDISPRKSYRKFYVPIQENHQKMLEDVCSNTIFGDYYSDS
jgi:hypothetical protein